MPEQLQIRRDTAANWSSTNPTPAQGEPCYETDTGVLKVGDGATAYNSLPEFGGLVDSVFGRTGAITAAASDYDASQVDNDSGVSGAKVSDALDALDSGKAAASHNHDASDINGGTLADARVAESNVTQHQAAVNINASQVNAGTLPVTRGGTGGGDAATARTNLGLVIGTNVQAQNAELAAIASDNTGNGNVSTSPSNYTAAGSTLDQHLAGIDTAIGSASSGLPHGFISGCLISNNGADANRDIDIAAGVCRDAANAVDITLSATTREIDAAYGTGNGGLSSSLTLAADTWYHVHAIVAGGSANVGFDTSLTAANLVTDHSATAYRRLGSVLTDSSSNIKAFFAYEFGRCVCYIWKDPPKDIDATQGSTRSLHTISVPPGIVVKASGNGYWFKSGTLTYLDLVPPDRDSETPSPSAAPLAMELGRTTAHMFTWSKLTNTSSQIAGISNDTGNTLRLTTDEWLEAR